MSRKILIPIALILALSLCVPASFAGEGEAGRAMELFSGVIGSVAFALPGRVSVLHEQDYPGAWKDSVQLTGVCAEDGAEFQMYTADVQALIDAFTQQYPDGDPNDIRLSALMNYCLFYPNHYGAEIGDMSPFISQSTGILGVNVTFTYPDAPGVTYCARCFLEGPTATGLVAMECDHTLEALDRLRIVGPEEKDALTKEKTTPVYLDLHGLGMTFPCSYTLREQENMLLAACFGADFTFMEVNAVPQSWDITGTEEEQTAFMTEAAKKMLAVFDTEEVLDPVLTRPTGTALRLDFTAVDKSTYGDYGPKYLCRVYAGEEGFWQVMASDTAAGRAFMDSVRLTGESAPAAPAADDPVQPAAAASFAAFRTSMNDLLDRENPGLRLKSGNFEWSDPLCSGGKWMRVLFSRDLTSAAQIILASPDEDAPIAEIRVLDSLLYRSEPDEGFIPFARLCGLALTGEDAGVEAERLSPEGSALVYERVILTPPAPVPLGEALPEPEGTIPDITLAQVPAAEFESRCKRLAPLWDTELTHLASQPTRQGSEARAYRLGDVGLIVYLNGVGDDSPVSMVIVMGSSEEDCPAVVAATMLAYAAMAGVDENHTVPLACALTEYPLWGDLCDLWPLLSDGRVCAHLQEDDEGLPMGFVAGVPGN